MIDNKINKGENIIKHDWSGNLPLVSIVIPVYNGANFLAQAIDSALAQTYKNIEILVVNDGSNDNNKTENIALSYGDKIKYFCKLNGGVASALNLGIKNMSGKYFSWLSHDDIYFPEKIEYQINILSSLDNYNTIIYGGYELIDEKFRSLGVVDLSGFPEEKLNTPLFPLLRGLIHGCSLLVPTIYFHEIGLFNESLRYVQDYDLWFRFLKVAPIRFHKRVLIYSRIHSGQDSRTLDSQKTAQSLKEGNELLCSFLQNMTQQEMIEVEGSPYLFLKQMSNYYSTLPYEQALNLSRLLVEETLLDTKISVVMCFYNRVHLVIEAIQSVLNQTHTCFELIVIDDGSTENVVDVVTKCDTDPRVIYIRTKNAGPGAARNVGIKQASGKYVAFLDSDDLFTPDKLEIQLKFMEENNSEFSHTSYQKIDIQGNIIGEVNSGSFSGQVFPEIIANCSIAVPTVMGRASIFKENPFPEHFKIGEDICLWISIARRYPIDGISAKLSKVRITDLSTSHNPEKILIGLTNITSFIMYDEYNRHFSKQIKKLLSKLTITLEDVKRPVHVSSVMPRKKLSYYGSQKSLIGKFIRSLKRDGLIRTGRKVLFWFRHYSKR